MDHKLDEKCVDVSNARQKANIRAKTIKMIQMYHNEQKDSCDAL